MGLNNGKLVGALCDCMAGLGELCSHVASLLWVIGVGVEKRNQQVTQQSAYWVMSPPVRSVQYLPIKEIDFIGKKRKSSLAVQVILSIQVQVVPGPASAEK